MKMPSKIESLCLAKTRRTLPDLLAVARETNTPLSALAVQIGCDHSAIYKYIKRNGIDWPDVMTMQRSGFGLTIRGVTATRDQHCRSAGVSYFAVAKIRQNFNLSFPEALDIAVSRRKKREARAEQSESRVAARAA